MGSSISSCVESGPIFALFQAVRQSDLRTIKFRLDLDPDLLLYRNLADRDTVWHLAAGAGSETVLAALGAHGGQLAPGQYLEAINLRNDRGQTALMHAAQAGHAAAVQWLLSQGADPWAHDRCGKRSALHYAAMRGRLECINTLLDSMGSTQEMCRYIEVRSISGLTPLHYAVASRQAEATRLLLERGADLRAVNTAGDAYDLIYVPLRSTALHVAAALNSQECAVAMLHYYHHHLASPNFPDPRRRVDALGRPPFRVALSRGAGLLAELLHPAAHLEAMFAREGVAAAASVPRLASLAAAAVRSQLVNDILHAEEVILDFRRRNPCGSSPTFMMRSQSAVLGPALELTPPGQPPPLTSPGLQPPRAQGEGGLTSLLEQPPDRRQEEGVWPGLGAAPCCAALDQRCLVVVPGSSSPAAATATAAAAAPSTSCCSGQRPPPQQQQWPGGRCAPVPEERAACCPPEQQQLQQRLGCFVTKSLQQQEKEEEVQQQRPQTLQMQQMKQHPKALCCTAEMQRAGCCSVEEQLAGCCGPEEERQEHLHLHQQEEEEEPEQGGEQQPVVCTPEQQRAGCCTAEEQQRGFRLVRPQRLRLGSETGPRLPDSSSGQLLHLPPLRIAPQRPLLLLPADTRGPMPNCCSVRVPSPFVRRSAGHVETGFSRAPLLPVTQCAVCLEDCYSLVSEPCHHRLCANCARDVTMRAPDMPPPCPVCRAAVHQFTSPVC